MTRRTGFLVFAAVIAWASRAAAAGGGIKLGPAMFFPSLNVTETYDDNFLLAASNLEDDWITSINPALRMVLPTRNLFLIAEGGLDVIAHREHVEEDSTDWFAGATVGGQFPGGLSFKLSDKYYDRYLVGSEEYGPGEDTATNTFEAKVAYARRGVLRFELSALRSSHDFETSLALARAETTVTAAAFWKFRPTLSALLEATFSDVGYDSNIAQDNGSTGVSLGFTWEVSARSTGLVKVGYQWKSYVTENEDLGTQNASYSIVTASIKHDFSRRTTVQADVSRSAEEADVTDFSGNPYYLKNAVGVSLSHRLTTKIYARAAGRYGRDEYPNETSYGIESGKRTDTTLTGSLGLGFDMTRWLSLEAGYEWEQRDSTFDTFDYTVNRYILSVKAAF